MKGKQANRAALAASNFPAKWTDTAIAMKPPKIARTSWWLDTPACGFTARASIEQPAMDRGPLGTITKPIIASDSGR